MSEIFFDRKLFIGTDMFRTLRRLRLMTDKEYSDACVCMYEKRALVYEKKR